MQDSKSTLLVPVEANKSALQLPVPKLVIEAGPAAKFAWEEFFQGKIRNRHTRIAYLRAVRRFLIWSERQQPDLARITPGVVGQYFNTLPISIPSKKLHLAALRAFFDVLVQRHVVVLNPAYSVRTERYSVVEGRTPTITTEQSRFLLNSIKSDSIIGLRDRAIIAVLIFTAVREGAVASLRLRDFAQDGTQFVLRFAEKGGKARSIPVRHDLESILREYVLLTQLDKQPKDSPLFRSMSAGRPLLSEQPITGGDICRMVKRRLRVANLPMNISPHSFRSCVATDLLLQGVALEDVQHLLGHSDVRTTRLYDRRQKQITRNIVERISV
jgi:integrase/recombinase XerD